MFRQNAFHTCKEYLFGYLSHLQCNIKIIEFPAKNICSAISLISYKINSEVTQTERKVTIPMTMVADE
jgi:hypothetical protein